MITGWILFLRARRSYAALLLLAGLALIERQLGAASILISRGFDISLPWVVIMPMVSGAIVGVSVRSGGQQIEAGAVRSMPVLRLGHLGMLATFTAAATWWGSTPLTGDYTGLSSSRNALGFVGLGLLGAVVLGAELAWLLPMGFGLASAIAGTSMGVARPWAWPIRGDGDETSRTIAIALLVAGAGIFSFAGNRVRVGGGD